jgi:hypothetical protein
MWIVTSKTSKLWNEGKTTMENSYYQYKIVYYTYKMLWCELHGNHKAKTTADIQIMKRKE